MTPSARGIRSHPRLTAISGAVVVGVIAVLGWLVFRAGSGAPGAWSDVAPMAVGHSYHTATTLDGPACRAVPRADYCGQVLVVGGVGPSELYDPVSGRWRPTGALLVPRSFHSATLLDGPRCHGDAPPAYCGQVLAAGGDGLNGFENSRESELYDPAAGTWAATGPLSEARGQHAAAELADGRVLVVGGRSADFREEYYPSTDVPTAEIYDPATRAWTATGDMAGAHAHPTATVLASGRCAGAASLIPCGTVLVVDGAGPTELLDPVTAAWRAGPPLDIAEVHTATALADGRVLVVGGHRAALFDPGAAQWQFTASPNGDYEYNTATSFTGAECDPGPPAPYCGQVLVIGGSRHPMAEVYDPVSARWTTVGGARDVRFGHSATLLADGDILVAGGDPEKLKKANPSKNIAGILPSRASVRRFNPSLALGAPRRPTVGVLGASEGPTTGLAAVVIGGSGFDGVRKVQFGAVPATSYRVLSRQRILAVSPAHQAGTVDIAVTTGSTRSPATASASYLFAEGSELPQPSVAAVDPTDGPLAGGAVVTITGGGFVFPFGATEVRVGGAPATDVRAVSASVLTARVPAGSEGLGDVTVTTPAGSSAPSAGAHFAYAHGGWQPVNPLPSCTPSEAPCGPRFQATATVLDGPECHQVSPPGYCGDVLVAGGSQDAACQGGQALTSADLYDPRTGSWRRTGSMATPRYEHTATLLGDGKVLVAGGKGASEGPTGDACGTAVATTEIYNPARGTWEAAGPMTDARFAHTATVLTGPACPAASLCGQVLVTGGSTMENNRPVIGAAELFDPATRSWTETAPLGHARANHSASVLADGSVLVVGGLGDGGGVPLSSAEIFDPATQTWAEAAPLASARFGHTATVLAEEPCAAQCGDVLVVGGADYYARGGAFHFLASAELYDPAANTWRIAGIPGVARAGHSATLLRNGRVLIAGGANPFAGAREGGNRALSSAELYDPATGEWQVARSLGTARGIHAAVLIDGPQCRRARPADPCGEVLVVGGSASGQGHDYLGIDSAELYSENTGNVP